MGIDIRGVTYLSIFAKVRAVCTVPAASPPSNTVANRGRRSLGLISLVPASQGRTPEGFPVNSRGWREARATPPDTRRSAPEPRRGSPGTRPSAVRGDGTTPPGWQAMKPPFPWVRSCLAHPRLFTENPSRVEMVDPCTDLRADYYWVKTGF